jgi:hypothetical protein
MTEDELADVQERFHATARLHGSGQLDLPCFRDLVAEVLLEVVGEPERRLPTPGDLSAAFTLADVDSSGLVDLEEFMALYALIRNGAVQGLGKKGVFASLKKGSFKKSFAQATPRASQKLSPPLPEEEAAVLPAHGAASAMMGGLTEAEADDARDRFQAACDAEGADELDKPAFSKLVLALLQEEGGAGGGGVALPSEQDLSVAFGMADADQSGKAPRRK